MRDIASWIWEQLEYPFLHGRIQWKLLRGALYFWLKANVVVLFAGLVLSKFWVAGGEFLVAFSGAVSGFMWVYLLARLAVALQIVASATQLSSGTLQQLSRILPGPPLNFPEMNQESVKTALRYIVSGFAALSGASAYASVFDVQNNLTLFFTTITLVFFMCFGVIAWRPVTKIDIFGLLVKSAFVLALFNTGYFAIVAVVPVEVRKETLSYFGVQSTSVSKEINRVKRMEEIKTDALQAIQQKRERVLSQVGSTGELTDAVTQELDRLESLESKIRQGGLQGSSAGNSQSFVPDLRSGKVRSLVFGLLFALLVGSFLIRRK